MDLSPPKVHDTHARNRCHKLTPEIWHQFLARLSWKSVAGFVWYHILAHVPRTLVHLGTPESILVISPVHRR